MGQPSPLLERNPELDALAAALRDASAGHGRVLLVEGPAGIGKTRLLEEAQRRATRQGMTVLAARGGELEREFSYGVVRQLFEAHLARASPSTRKKLLAGAAALAAPVVASSEAEPSFPGDPGYPILHGLYWLAANLATETPIALTVDDVHHADRASGPVHHWCITRASVGSVLRHDRRSKNLVVEPNQAILAKNPAYRPAKENPCIGGDFLLRAQLRCISRIPRWLDVQGADGRALVVSRARAPAVNVPCVSARLKLRS